MIVNDFVRKSEKHIRHLVLNARDLPASLAFDLTFVTGSRVGNATWIALLRHCLAFTSIRRAGRRTSCLLASAKHTSGPCPVDRLAGLVVKTSASRAENPGFESRFRRDFFRGRVIPVTLKSGTPVATLPGAWHYRVSTGTGRPGVSILWLGEVERLICNFYLSVAARIIVWADPSPRYTRLLLGR